MTNATLPCSRRDFMRCAMAAGAYSMVRPVAGFATPSADGSLSSLALPTAAHKAWADMELGMFFHFDIPIYRPGWRWRSFADHPDPSLYNPARLDTDQWMEAAKAWRYGSFRGLCARGAFEVDCTWCGGRPVSVEVRSKKGLEPTVNFGGRRIPLERNGSVYRYAEHKERECHA